MTHWVYGSGSFGCSYDNGPHIVPDKSSAIDGALAPFLDSDPCLTEEQEKQARESLDAGTSFGIYHLPSGLGADYCEVSECDCTELDHLSELDSE